MAATVYQMRVATLEESETCCNCGVEFASPVLRERLKDGKWFYCPNGHSQHYTKTTAQLLQEQLDTERLKREQAERDRDWAKADARNAQTQKMKAQNKLKKIETRVNAGVCPHCNRTFSQLARHMHSKHPECDHNSTT